MVATELPVLGEVVVHTAGAAGVSDTGHASAEDDGCKASSRAHDPVLVPLPRPVRFVTRDLARELSFAGRSSARRGNQSSLLQLLRARHTRAGGIRAVPRWPPRERTRVRSGARTRRHRRRLVVPAAGTP